MGSPRTPGALGDTWFKLLFTLVQYISGRDWGGGLL